MTCFLCLRHAYKYVLWQRRPEDLKASRHLDSSILMPLPTSDALRQDDHALLDWVVTGYGYPPYPGIKLIWARQEPFARIWRRKAAREEGVELRFIPVSHLGCRTDHIQSFAEELSRCIGEAQMLSGLGRAAHEL